MRKDTKDIMKGLVVVALVLFFLGVAMADPNGAAVYFGGPY